MWTSEETADFDTLNEQSVSEGRELPDFVKEVLRRHLRGI